MRWGGGEARTVCIWRRGRGSGLPRLLYTWPLKMTDWAECKSLTQSVRVAGASNLLRAVPSLLRRTSIKQAMRAFSQQQLHLNLVDDATVVSPYLPCDPPVRLEASLEIPKLKHLTHPTQHYLLKPSPLYKLSPFFETEGLVLEQQTNRSRRLHTLSPSYCCCVLGLCQVEVKLGIIHQSPCTQ